MATTFRDPVVVYNEFNMTHASSVSYKNGSIANAAISSGAAIDRSKLAQDADGVYIIPFTGMRVQDNLSTLLPAIASGSDLGLIDGTFGTDAAVLQTSDAKATTVTQYARFLFGLPVEYDDGASITVRVRAGMETTISDGTATVDVECFKQDRDGAVGADLCATAAQSCNTLANSDLSFIITPTGVAAGEVLDIRLAVAITDAATATAVIGEITEAAMLLDVRG